MSDWMKVWLLFLIDDAGLLYLFQVMLVAFLCFAELSDRSVFDKPTGASATVTRGEASWNVLNFAFGIVAINVLQIINSANDNAKFKVLMSAFDLVAMIRLFFFNGWFRNKAIGVVSRARNLQEGRR